MPKIAIKVEAYSGYKAEERPRSMTIGDRTLEVKAVVDRWYGLDHDYFKVLADDGYIYIIRHDRASLAWELVMMEVGPTGPGVSGADEGAEGEGGGER